MNLGPAGRKYCSQRWLATARKAQRADSIVAGRSPYKKSVKAQRADSIVATTAPLLNPAKARFIRCSTAEGYNTFGPPGLAGVVGCCLLQYFRPAGPCGANDGRWRLQYFRPAGPCTVGHSPLATRHSPLVHSPQNTVNVVPTPTVLVTSRRQPLASAMRLTR